MTDAGCGPKFILTHWGTLVYCDEDGNLRHGPLGQVPRNVFVFEQPDVILSKQHRHPVELVAGAGRTASIRGDGYFYCAELDGGFSCNREVSGPWEQAVLLAEDEVEILSALHNDDWTLRDATIIAARDVQCEEGFRLRFGSMEIDLKTPGNIAVAERAEGHIAAINIVHGGWQVAAARRFRPLIYFAVFGPDHIFDMLQLCLMSITKFGDFTGHVLILSDREPDRMANYIPEPLADRTIFFYRDVASHANMMMERFDISALPIEEFQPVLCLDADMVCDGPIMPMLARCNTAAKFSGSAEYGGMTIAEMNVGIGNWFGRFLFEAARQKFDQAQGLNGGAIAFPQQKKAIPVFKLVAHAFAKSVQNFEHFKGMGEQPVLNYVLQSLSLIDADALNDFIQFRNQCLGTQERRGLMHFNYLVGGDKLGDMQGYFEAICRDRGT